MISDLIELAAAFGLFLVVHGLGVLRERNRKPKPPPPPAPPNLRCGCGHELSFHDGLGACSKVDQLVVSSDYQTGERTYKADPCACLQYTGELPADWFSRSGGLS